MLVYITGTQGHSEEEIEKARSLVESFGDKPVTPDGGDVKRAVGNCNACCCRWEPTGEEERLCRSLIRIEYIPGRG